MLPVCRLESCLTLHSKNEPSSQPASRPRHAKIRHSRWKWVHCSTGWTPNWPPLIVAVMLSKMRAITPKGNFSNWWQRKKENERRKSGWKGREKPWVTWLPVWEKEGGGGISQTVETSAIFNIKRTGGGVLSCSLNPLQCFRAAIIVFTIVCGWGKKKKKEEGAEEGKKNLSLCVGRTQQESDFVIIWVCQQSKALPPDLQQHLVYSAPLLPHTRATYECASRAGKQRHPGFSWWWELTSDWFPWILMWRIVCFIEEQKEARWLPFRIC